MAETTREATMRDDDLRLNTTSDERFGAGAPDAGMLGVPTGPLQSPLIPSALPDGWTEADTSAFRLLNYRFGTQGEIYVSLSQGGILNNANRWLGQFGESLLTDESFRKLEGVQLPGFRGVWVNAAGTYAAGMGKPPVPDFALAGIVTVGPGGLFTVKMVGPADEVAAEEERLRQFVASLKPVN